MTFTNRIADAEKLQQEINRHRPPKGPALKQLRDYLRIKLTWASNALEGNSLTETETKVVIEDGITIGGKPLKDHFEAIGHAEAFDYLQKLARRREITERDILKLHKTLLLPNRRGQRRPLPEAEHHRHRHRLRFPRTQRAEGVDDCLCR